MIRNTSIMTFAFGCSIVLSIPAAFSDQSAADPKASLSKWTIEKCYGPKSNMTAHGVGQVNDVFDVHMSDGKIALVQNKNVLTCDVLAKCNIGAQIPTMAGGFGSTEYLTLQNGKTVSYDMAGNVNCDAAKQRNADLEKLPREWCSKPEMPAAWKKCVQDSDCISASRGGFEQCRHEHINKTHLQDAEKYLSSCDPCLPKFPPKESVCSNGTCQSVGMFSVVKETSDQTRENCLSELRSPASSRKANPGIVPKADVYCACMGDLAGKNHFDTSKMYKIIVSPGIQNGPQPTDAQQQAAIKTWRGFEADCRKKIGVNGDYSWK